MEEAGDITAVDAYAHTWRNTTRYDQHPPSKNISHEAAAFLCALRDSSLRASHQAWPPNLLVKEDLLYYSDPRSQIARLVVPPALRLKLLYVAHDAPTSGHRGATATYKALATTYWWPQMRSETYHYCSGCLKCHKSKATQKTKIQYMSHYVNCVPGHTIHIDHFGPFVPSTRGNTVVLTVIDRASGYVWVYPCKDSTAATVAETLYFDHFVDNGIASRIVSDNGPAFRSALLFELAKLSKIHHLFTSPYRPQSNGKVERVHRTLKAGIKIYVDPSQRDWDRVIKVVSYAIRTSVIDGTNYTPYYLWFGRHPETPLHILAQPEDPDNVDLPLHYVQAQREALELIQKLESDKKQKYEKLNIGLQRPPVWEVGQTILVKREIINKDLSRKFIYQWAGPYCITRRVSPVNYAVDLGNGVNQTYHVNRLHAFMPSSHPLSSFQEPVDLFDIDSENVPDSDPLAEHIPTVVPQEGHMVLALVDDELVLAKVQRIDSDDQKVLVHLYDTKTLGSTTSDPTRWNDSWFPLYLTHDSGLIVRKTRDANENIPVEVRIDYGDLVDVPFRLNAQQRLNLAQKRVVQSWKTGTYDNPEVPSV